jgi:hypothetical protein
MAERKKEWYDRRAEDFVREAWPHLVFTQEDIDKLAADYRDLASSCEPLTSLDY